MRTSRTVSRILYRRVSPSAATIHLGAPLPAPSSGLPESSGGQPSNASCLTLLPVGFTEPFRSPGTLVVSYTTVSPLPPRPPEGRPGGGLFSVALSRGSPRVGVTHHRALWSPDFPRRAHHCTRRGRPSDSSAGLTLAPNQRGLRRSRNGPCRSPRRPGRAVPGPGRRAARSRVPRPGPAGRAPGLSHPCG